MGQREDLVRQHLADEERKQQERAVLKARTDAAELAQLNRQYDELIAAFDDEGKRIASRLKNADWSKATLKMFTYPKKHRWSRKPLEEFACIQFASSLHGWGGWMRSDNLLFIGDGRDCLRRPSAHFERTTSNVGMRRQVKEMGEVLDALKTHKAAA
ncbi:MAG: hypothetical protein V4678_02365 [Patescibacteria group bacterium]